VKEIFADTFCWIALTVPTAPEYVRREAGATIQDILQDANIRILPQSRKPFLDGVALYIARPDKGYSLIDCISMLTMRREGLTEALTNHRHFEQEGFRALFRS
jgi:predicted nucleic acid-binding protein